MKREFQLKTVVSILIISIFAPVTFSQANWTVKSSANSGLVNNIVRKIYKDSNGKIWVGTANGLNVITDNNWEIYTKSNGLSHKTVTDIGEDDDGNIWVATLKRYHFV